MKIAFTPLLVALAATSWAGAKPMVVVFLKATCPHTKAAIPGLNQLNRDLAAKAQFVAYVNLPQAEIAAFKKNMGAVFNISPDPDSKRTLAAGGTHSLDFALMVPGKKPHVWKGFGPKSLGELGRALGCTFKSKAYPSKLLSGCGF